MVAEIALRVVPKVVDELRVALAHLEAELARKVAPCLAHPRREADEQVSAVFGEAHELLRRERILQPFELRHEQCKVVVLALAEREQDVVALRIARLGQGHLVAALVEGLDKARVVFFFVIQHQKHEVSVRAHSQRRLHTQCQRTHHSQPTLPHGGPSEPRRTEST